MGLPSLAGSNFELLERDVDLDGRLIVDSIDLESEELAKLVFEGFEIRKDWKRLRRDRAPSLGDQLLDVLPHFPVIHPNPPLVVERRSLSGASVIGEQTKDLVDRALEEALLRQDLVGDRQIERDAGIADDAWVTTAALTETQLRPPAGLIAASRARAVFSRSPLARPIVPVR